MKTSLDKKEENKNQHVNNETTQKKSSSQPTSQLGDKRPEVIAQRKLQEKAADSAQVKQLNAFQNMVNNSPRMTEQIQLKSSKENTPSNIQEQPIQQKKNKTGLPDQLKSGVENLSGISMDDVKVHYNSSKPAQLQAHAYAQGNNIHLGPGQEKHLPHEAWHVVQQKQGRVLPSKQMKSKVNINDDADLEREADVMGAKALQAKSKGNTPIAKSISSRTAQLVVDERKRPQIDDRVNDLKAEVIHIWENLSKEGEDWELIKAAERREQGEEKAKEKLDGKKEKSPSTSEKILKKVLKEMWSKASALDKIKIVGLLGSAGLATVVAVIGAVGVGIKEAIGLGADANGSGSGEKKSESDSSWVDRITDKELEAVYKVYQYHQEYKKKLQEAKSKVIETTGDVAEWFGGKEGIQKVKMDFSKKVKEGLRKLIVARKRLGLIQKAIKQNKDEVRYGSIETAIADALLMEGDFGDLTLWLGLNDDLKLVDGFKEFEQKGLEKVANLKEASIDLGGAAGFFGHHFDRLDDKLTGLGSKKRMEDTKANLIGKLKEVIDLWMKKMRIPPDGVKQLNEELRKDTSPTEKLQGATNIAVGRMKKNSKRDEITQILYETLQKLQPDDLRNLKKSISELESIKSELG